MGLHNLIISYFKELGFKTEAWRCRKEVRPNDDEIYVYSIIPGLYSIEIVEKGLQAGVVKTSGIPGFEYEVSILDPSSLVTIHKSIRELYIWMENINNQCAKGLVNEGEGFCS